MVRRPLAVAIVGAGVHACVVAVRLLHARPALRAHLKFIDPAGSCLAAFDRRTWGQGMEAMRSPGAHHLDVPAESLLHFARVHGREGELAPPYSRPSLQLFMDHARRVIETYRLDELVVPTTVSRVEPEPHAPGYRLACADGTVLRARWLVLAPGPAGHERVPDWAAALARQAPGVAAHAEQVDIRREALAGEPVLVVGGGLSAATLAAAAARRGARVTVVSRHRLEPRLFDADPGWVGPRYLRFFQQEPDPAARLRMIRRARGRGTVTPELLAQLGGLRAEGRVRLLEEDEVVEARPDGRGGAAVAFRRAGREALRYRRVWYCTGFEPRLERLDWLAPLGEVPACEGRPVVGPTLELRPGCFVTGWLAELWVGPAARNISGARHAAGLIAGAILGQPGAAGGFQSAVA